MSIKMSKDVLLIECERGNFHHVNDTSDSKEMSMQFCADMKDALIELSTLTAKAKRYEEALKFYADILSWTHLKGENDFPWGRPVILYDDCGHVYPDNEWCSYGGKRARAALNQGEEREFFEMQNAKGKFEK